MEQKNYSAKQVEYCYFIAGGGDYGVEMQFQVKNTFNIYLISKL
jgi:hypothetical protein